MKKLVLFAAVAVAVSFASCSNKPNADATAETVDSTVVVEQVEEVVVPVADSAAVVVEEVAAKTPATK